MDLSDKMLAMVLSGPGEPLSEVINQLSDAATFSEPQIIPQITLTVVANHGLFVVQGERG